MLRPSYLSNRAAKGEDSCLDGHGVLEEKQIQKRGL